MNRLKIKYTIRHKRCFLLTEKKLLGKNTIRGYLHDIDKLVMLIFLDKNKCQEIHRRCSKHHLRAKSKSDFIQMVIDWECARITKPDKPMNARKTLDKLYPHLKDNITPILKELNL